MDWEIDFLEWLVSIGSGNATMNWFSWILLIITLSCDSLLILIVLTAVMLFFKKYRRAGITCAFGLIFFALLANDVLIKHLVARERPLYQSDYLLENISNWMLPTGSSFMGLFEVPDSYSFMSGHSFGTFMFATILFAYHKKEGLVAYAFAAIVAFSRLYFGVHYPTDVLFGMVFGVAFGFLAIFFSEFILQKGFKQEDAFAR